MRSSMVFSITRRISHYQRTIGPQRFPWLSFTTSSSRHSNIHQSGAGSNDDIQDYFRVLGIERSFTVPQSELKSKYRSLMSELHPDRHASEPPEEQERLHFLASNVTRAYDVIVHDHSRARHILELGGEPIDETDTGDLVGDDFLMATMEIREQVDDASTDEELQDILESNQKQVKETCKKIGDAFQRNDLTEAKRLTAQLQYLNRIDETIRERICNVR